MGAWEHALNKFLVEWKKKDYVLGAMATGSYVIGRATKYSDIDVHIILSDNIEWRERGNKIVDNFLIEYFANPIHRLKSYQEEDQRENSRTSARMFCTGKIIFDKTGIVTKLKLDAEKEIKREFKNPDDIWIELAKYKLWDHLDTLKDLNDRNAQNFEYVYYLTLENLITTYAKYVRAEVPPPFKISTILTDDTFRRDYKFEKFPDHELVELLLKCLEKKEHAQMLESIKKLMNYVLEKMGGFKIDGWKIRTPADG